MGKKFAFITFVIFLISCENVRVCDCQGLETLHSFQVIDTLTNTDLIFGPSPQFVLDSLEIISIVNNQVVKAPISKDINFVTKDTVINVMLDIFNANRFFVRWDYADIDTIEMTTQTVKKGCCKGAIFITSFRNNGLEMEQKNGVKIFKK